MISSFSFKKITLNIVVYVQRDLADTVLWHWELETHPPSFTKPDPAINLPSCVASSLATKLDDLRVVNVLPVRCLCCFGRNLQKRSCNQKTFPLRLQPPKIPWTLWQSGQSHSLLWVLWGRISLQNMRHGSTGSGRWKMPSTCVTWVIQVKCVKFTADTCFSSCCSLKWTHFLSLLNKYNLYINHVPGTVLSTIKKYNDESDMNEPLTRLLTVSLCLWIFLHSTTWV